MDQGAAVVLLMLMGAKVWAGAEAEALPQGAAVAQAEAEAGVLNLNLNVKSTLGNLMEIGLPVSEVPERRDHSCPVPICCIFAWSLMFLERVLYRWMLFDLVDDA